MNFECARAEFLISEEEYAADAVIADVTVFAYVVLICLSAPRQSGRRRRMRLKSPPNKYAEYIQYAMPFRQTLGPYHLADL